MKNMKKIKEEIQRNEMVKSMCDCIEKYADEDAFYEWWECLPEETEEICKDADTYDKVCELFERLCPEGYAKLFGGEV